jgi:hypothetical protein
MALNDAEALLDSSDSYDSFLKKLIFKREQTGREEGLSSPDSGDASYYLKTLNTLQQAPEAWYHEEKKKLKVKPTGLKSTRTGTSRQMAIPLQKMKIQQDMVNAGLDPEEHDIESMIDSSLSFRENRDIVARQLGYSYSARKKKEVQELTRHSQCLEAQEKCEVKGDPEACSEYVSSGCHKTYGALENPMIELVEGSM